MKELSPHQLEKSEDGEYCVDTRFLRTATFSSEKELSAYVCGKISDFVSIILDDEMISFETEKELGMGRVFFGPCQKRIDLYIRSKGSNYIIELKNAKSSPANIEAIGQLLNYGRAMECGAINHQLVLITTFFDLDTAKTIQKYDLPIRYMFIDRRHILEFRRINNENDVNSTVLE